MAGQKVSRSSFFNKRWGFPLGLTLLTIGLIFVYRNQGLQSFVEQQGQNLADFYAANLEPLFSRGQLTKEDVFNFAFYKELPVDKDNSQVLQFGSDSSGKEYFEFRKAAYNPRTDNLEQFSGLLELNGKQRQKLDSVLNFYKEKIQAQILVNDKNTMAINSNLWNLNKALMADLLLFASKANSIKFKKVLPGEYYAVDEPAMQQMISEANSGNKNKYIFVHSDTIFTKEFNYDFDNTSFANSENKRQPASAKPSSPQASAVQLQKTNSDDNKELKLKIKFNNDLIRAYSRNYFDDKRRFQVKVDSNSLRVKVPELSEKDIPDWEKINKEVEKAARQIREMSLKFKTPVPPVPEHFNRKKGVIPPKPGADDGQEFELNIDLPDVDSIVHAAIEGSLDAIGKINIDSVKNEDGSKRKLTKEEKEEIKKEMQKVKEEMKKLKKFKNKDNN
ncbi:MAG: hypothetical protein ACM34K_07320 [Bacillota bacterium]